MPRHPEVLMRRNVEHFGRPERAPTHWLPALLAIGTLVAAVLLVAAPCFLALTRYYGA